MLFTIVTVTLNSETTIAKAIESVLGQTFHDYEYIVQDGASTDSTIEIAKRVGKERVNIFIEKDMGISHAFNKGILKSQGEYILLLSSDDMFYDSGVLGKVAKFIQSEGRPSILHGDTVHDYLARPKIVSGNPDIRYLRKGMMVNHSTCFIRRDIYQRHGLFNLSYKLAMDYELLLRFYLAKTEFTYMPLVVTRAGMDGVSSKNIFASLREVYKIQRAHKIPQPVALSNYLRSTIRLFCRRGLTRIGLNVLVRIYQKRLSINKKIPFRSKSCSDKIETMGS